MEECVAGWQEDNFFANRKQTVISSRSNLHLDWNSTASGTKLTKNAKKALILHRSSNRKISLVIGHCLPRLCHWGGRRAGRRLLHLHNNWLLLVGARWSRYLPSNPLCAGFSPSRPLEVQQFKQCAAILFSAHTQTQKLLRQYAVVEASI